MRNSLVAHLLIWLQLHADFFKFMFQNIQNNLLNKTEELFVIQETVQPLCTAQTA